MNNISNEDNMKIESEIRRLKKEKNALILGHYYQTMDIQLIADFVGDSFDSHESHYAIRV